MACYWPYLFTVTTLMLAVSSQCRIFAQSLASYSWQSTDASHNQPSGPYYPLCRLYHGRGPLPPVGLPISCQFFNTLFWCLNVWIFSVGLHVITTTTKKGRQLFGGKSWLRVREKGPRLTLVWGPRMVNPAVHTISYFVFAFKGIICDFLHALSSDQASQVISV